MRYGFLYHLQSIGFTIPQNEKKKDKELTERISRILKQRDDILTGVDIGGFVSYVLAGQIDLFLGHLEKVQIGVDHLVSRCISKLKHC